MLTLIIKKKWFDMIKTGEKKEEYRDISPYYISRLGKYKDQTIEVCLQNGYTSTSPTLNILCTVTLGEGKKAWGAVPGRYYFVLKIAKILCDKGV